MGLEELFRAHDPSGSGMISTDQFRSALQTYGVKNALDSVMNRFHDSGVDRVSYSRFLAYFNQAKGSTGVRSVSDSIPQSPTKAIPPSPTPSVLASPQVAKERRLQDLRFKYRSESSAEALVKQKEKLNRLFKSLDSSESGTVDRAVLVQELRANGIDSEQQPTLRSLVDSCVIDGSKVDYSRFLTAASEQFSSSVQPLCIPQDLPSSSSSPAPSSSVISSSSALPSPAKTPRRLILSADEAGQRTANNPLSSVAKRLYGRFPQVFEAFHASDAGRDGFVSKDAFSSTLRQLNAVAGDSELSDVLSKAPTSADGRVDYVNFILNLESSDRFTSRIFSEAPAAAVLSSPSKSERRGAVLDRDGQSKFQLDISQRDPILHDGVADLPSASQSQSFNVSQTQILNPLASSSPNVPNDVVRKHFEHAPSMSNIISWKVESQGPIDLADKAVDDLCNRVRDKVYGRSNLVKDSFRAFDENKDGIISGTEFKKGLKNIGVVADERVVDRLIQRIDRDGNGSIDFNEFADSLQVKDHPNVPINEVQEHQDFYYGGRKGLAGKSLESSDIFNQSLASASSAPSDNGADSALRSSKKLSIFRSASSVNMPLEVSSEVKRDLVVKALAEQIMAKAERKTSKVRDLFRSFDANHDNTVSYDEFRQGLRNLGIPVTEEIFSHLIRKADSQGKGYVDYQEFVNVMRFDDMQREDPFAAAFANKAVDPQVRRARFAQPETAGLLGGEGSESSSLDRHYDLISSSGVFLSPSANSGRRVAQKQRDNGPELTATEKKDALLRQKIVQRLSRSSLSVKDAFKSFDENKDGILSYDEIRRGLTRVGVDLTIPEFERLTSYLDRDKSGTIDAQEFTHLFTSDDMVPSSSSFVDDCASMSSASASADIPAHMRSNMSVIGLVRDESKSKSHLFAATERERKEKIARHKIMEQLSGRNEFIEDAFHSFDANGDGDVTVQEFKDGLNSLGVKLSDEELSLTVSKFVDRDEPDIVDYRRFAKYFASDDLHSKHLSTSSSIPQSAVAVDASPVDNDSVVLSHHFLSEHNRLQQQEQQPMSAISEEFPLVHSESVGASSSRLEQDARSQMESRRKGLEASAAASVAPHLMSSMLNIAPSSPRASQEFSLPSASSAPATPSASSSFARPATAPAAPSSTKQVQLVVDDIINKAVRRDLLSAVHNKAAKLRDTFRLFDSRKSCSLTIPEFRRALKSLGASVPESIIDRAVSMATVVQQSDNGSVVSRCDYERFLSTLGLTSKLSNDVSKFQRGSYDQKVQTFNAESQSDLLRHDVAGNGEDVQAIAIATSQLLAQEAVAGPSPFSIQVDGAPASRAFTAIPTSPSKQQQEGDLFTRSLASIGIRHASPTKSYYTAIDSGDIIGHRSPVRSRGLGPSSRSAVDSYRKDSGNIINHAPQSSNVVDQLNLSPRKLRSSVPAAGSTMSSVLQFNGSAAQASAGFLTPRATPSSTFDFSSSSDQKSRVDVDVASVVMKRARGSSKKVAENFRRFDSSGQGVVSHSDFERGLREMGVYLSEKKVLGLLKKYDPSGTGKISYSEFASESYKADLGSTAADVPSHMHAVRVRNPLSSPGFNVVTNEGLAGASPSSASAPVASDKLFQGKKRVAVADEMSKEPEIRSSIQIAVDVKRDSGNLFTVRYNSDGTPVKDKMFLEKRKIAGAPRGSPIVHELDASASAAAAKSPRTTQSFRQPKTAEEQVKEKIESKLFQSAGSLRKAFVALDRDKDGSVSADDLQAAMRGLNVDLTRRNVNQVMRMFNANSSSGGEKSGITFQEFASVFGANESPLSKSGAAASILPGHAVPAASGEIGASSVASSLTPRGARRNLAEDPHYGVFVIDSHRESPQYYQRRNQSTLSLGHSDAPSASSPAERAFSPSKRRIPQSDSGNFLAHSYEPQPALNSPRHSGQQA